MGSVGSNKAPTPVFNINRDRYNGWVSETQKERAENAITEVQKVIQELLSADRFRNYDTIDEWIDSLWNGIHDAFSISAPDDEAIKILDTRDGDLIGVDIDLYTTRDKKLGVGLKPIIWNQNDFSDDELYEYFYIEKR